MWAADRHTWTGMDSKCVRFINVHRYYHSCWICFGPCDVFTIGRLKPAFCGHFPWPKFSFSSWGSKHYGSPKQATEFSHCGEFPESVVTRGPRFWPTKYWEHLVGHLIFAYCRHFPWPKVICWVQGRTTMVPPTCDWHEPSLKFVTDKFLAISVNVWAPSDVEFINHGRVLWPISDLNPPGQF